MAAGTWWGYLPVWADTADAAPCLSCLKDAGKRPGVEAPEEQIPAAFPADDPRVLPPNGSVIQRDQDFQPGPASKPSAEGRTALPMPSVVFTERALLSLLQKEEVLLVNYGPEHPELLAIRARIKVVREFLQQQQTASPPVPLCQNAVPEADPQVIRKTEYVAKPSGAGSPVVLAPTPLVAAADESPAKSLAIKPSTDAVTASTPTPSVVVHGQAPSERRMVDPLPPSSFNGWWILGGMMGFFLLGLLVHVGGLVYLARRIGAQGTPTVRIEWAQLPGQPPFAPATVTGTAPASPPAAAASGPSPTIAAGTAVSDKEAAQQRREAAVLRQILEQNLQLRQDIEALPTAT